MPQSQIFAVLDIGTAKIVCLIARIDQVFGDDDFEPVADQITILGVGFKRSAGIKSGHVTDINAVEVAIRSTVSEAERMAGLSVDEVIVALSCGRLKSENFAATENIKNQTVTADEIERVMTAGYEYATRQKKHVLHLNPISFSLDDNMSIRDPENMIGNRLSVDMHSISGDELPIQNVVHAVERCHLNVVGLVATPYASGLAAVTEDEANLGVTCIDIGHGTTSASIFMENHLIYVDVITLGSQQVTFDIARNLTTPIHEAERIKVLFGSVMSAESDNHELITVPMVGGDQLENSELTRAQLSTLIRPRFEEMIRVVFDRIDRGGFGCYTGNQVVLTGGASQMPGLTELIGRMTGRSARIGRPRRIAGMPEQAGGPEYSAAVGSLLYPFQPHVTLGSWETGFLSTPGEGYFARVGNWLKDSF